MSMHTGSNGHTETVVKDLLERLRARPQAEKPEEMPKPNRDGEVALAEGVREAIRLTKSFEGLRDAVKTAKTLYLQRSSIGDHGVTSLVRAFRDGDVSSLRHLDLSDNGITEQGFGSLTEILEAGVLGGLEHLNVSHNLIRDDGSEQLASILKKGRLSSLQHLDLSHCYITNTGLERLSDAMQSGQFTGWGLQYLDLSANVFGEPGVLALSNVLTMRRLPYLKHLNLSYNMVGEKGTLALAGVIKSGHLSGLAHLHLARCHLGDGLFVIFEAMEAGRLPNLQSLDVSSNYLGEQGTVALARALRSGRLTKLQFLALSQCGIRAEWIEPISEALETGRVWDLRHLDLSHNTLNVEGSISKDQGSTALTRVMKQGHLHSLQVLNLSHCFLTDSGVSALAEEMEVGHLPKLHRCLMMNNEVTSERTLVAIVRALESGKVPDLKELELGHNSLGDDVTMALASLLEGTSARGPLIYNLKERLWSQKGPMVSIIGQLIKFLESISGWKLRNEVRSASGRAWNQKLNRQRSYLVVDEEKPSANNDKLLFNIMLFVFWFIAVLVSLA